VADTGLGEFDTQLTPAEETAFAAWKQQYAPRDSGADYDLRGAFKAGLTPDPATGHWPDTFKKPNHPTFSNQSMYAVGPNATKAGRWDGEKFIPPAPPVSTPLPIGNVPPQTSTSSLGAMRVAGGVDLKQENARFLGQLREMIAAAPPEVVANTQVISGYRSPEQQKEIYDRHVAQYGSGDVYGHQAARPGHSQHNFGLAADLKFTSPEAQKWFYDNAKNYGLSFPVPGDIGHMEPVWARQGGAGHMMAAKAASPAQPQPVAPAPAPVAAASGLSPELRAALTAGAPSIVTAPEAQQQQAIPPPPNYPTLNTPAPGQPSTAYRTALSNILARKSANPFAG
jgi:hypothetical protein